MSAARGREGGSAPSTGIRPPGDDAAYAAVVSSWIGRSGGPNPAAGALGPKVAVSSPQWSTASLGGPVHVVLRHPEADWSNRAGYVLASALNPGFVVLEMRETPASADRRGLPWDALVDPDRHLVVSVPEAGAEGPPMWPITRVDHPYEPLSDLATFLARPEATERLFRPQLPEIRPLPILIANGGIAARRFPDDPIATGYLMGVQKRFQISVIFAADETPRRDYMAFDYVFDVRPDASDAAGHRLRCARSPPGSAVHPGDELPLDAFEGGAAALGRLGQPSPAIRGTAPTPT